MKYSMKRIIFIICILLFAGASIKPYSLAAVDFNQQLFQQLSVGKNPTPHITMPDYRRIVLNNGLIIYLAEDHTHPILFIGGMIQGGRSQERKTTAGISSFMVDLMNTGTQNYGEEQLSRFAEDHALQFEVKTADDNFTFSGNSLITEQNALVSLTAEILQRPNFRADYYQRKLKERETELLQAKTKEVALTNMYFNRAIYKNHPYSLSTDIDQQLAALPKISPSKLEKYYNSLFAPNNMVLYICGDFKFAQMEALIKTQFEKWSQKAIPLTQPLVKENRASYGQIILVNKPDATQARIKMGYSLYGHDFYEKNQPETIAFDLGNIIYGGGDFESYLMREIRSEKGFAYDISSGTAIQKLGGMFAINTSVKPEKTYETVTAVKRIMTELKTGERCMTDPELFKIVNQRNAFFPEQYRYTESLIYNLIYNTEYRHRDKEYLNQYIGRYNQISAAQAQAAFSKYAFPGKMLTVIVGKKQDILPLFEAKGIKVKLVEME